MKKILTLALVALMAITMIVPTAAVENKVVYSQDFNTVKSFDELGWEKIESLTVCTGSWTVQDGKLYVDNRKSDANPTSKDSYYVVVPASIMKDVVKDDFTVQWDFQYIDSGDAARYLNLLLFYDREMGNSYFSFHYRPKGYADFQTRLFGSWTHLDTSGSSDGDVTRPKAANTDPAVGEPICKYIYGLDYVDADTKLTNGQPETTVRIEYHAGKTLKVFMNDKFVTATDDAGWENLALIADPNDGYCEIAIKAGTTIYATMDNIIVATGIGIPADAKPAETTTAAPVTTAAPTTTAAPATTAAPVVTPATADMTAVYAMAAMALTAVVAVLTKKARAK